MTAELLPRRMRRLLDVGELNPADFSAVRGARLMACTTLPRLHGILSVNPWNQRVADGGLTGDGADGRRGGVPIGGFCAGALSAVRVALADNFVEQGEPAPPSASSTGARWSSSTAAGPMRPGPGRGRRDTITDFYWWARLLSLLLLRLVDQCWRGRPRRPDRVGVAEFAAAARRRPPFAMPSPTGPACRPSVVT